MSFTINLLRLIRYSAAASLWRDFVKSGIWLLNLYLKTELFYPHNYIWFFSAESYKLFLKKNLYANQQLKQADSHIIFFLFREPIRKLLVTACAIFAAIPLLFVSSSAIFNQVEWLSMQTAYFYLTRILEIGCFRTYP